MTATSCFSGILGLGLLLGVTGCSTRPTTPSSAVGAATSGGVESSPADLALKQVMEQDDKAQAEVDVWIKESEAFDQAGAGTQKANLQSRIEQRLDQIDRLYRNLLNRYSTNAEAHLAYGSFRNDLRDEEGAVEHWEKARTLDPSNPAAWNNLANYYGHRGPVIKAFDYYAKAHELDPKEPVYLWNLATTVYLFRVDAQEFYGIDETGVFDKALGLYRQALALDPTNFILASDYANSFYGTKPARYEDGIVAWEAAYKVAGDDIEREGVRIHLARCHLNLGRYDQAEAQLALVTQPMYDPLKQRLGKRIAEKRAGKMVDEEPEAPAAPAHSHP